MVSLSMVESAETSPRMYPAKCCQPTSQAMMDTDQKKMTDDKVRWSRRDAAELGVWHTVSWLRAWKKDQSI
jgi:hypothetical protein